MVRGRSRDHIFEDETQAVMHTLASAGATEPALLVTPEGKTYVVFLADDLVEISTRHPSSRVVRRVVDTS
jgi:hypothetical protein